MSRRKRRRKKNPACRHPSRSNLSLNRPPLLLLRSQHRPAVEAAPGKLLRRKKPPKRNPRLRNRQRKKQPKRLPRKPRKPRKPLRSPRRKRARSAVKSFPGRERLRSREIKPRPQGRGFNFVELGIRSNVSSFRQPSSLAPAS